MKNSLAVILTLLLITFASALCGFAATYDIKSMGMQIATLDIVSSAAEGFTEVKVVSVTHNSIFPELNNLYRVEFDANFLPYRYSRRILQEEISDDVVTIYDHTNYRAEITRKSLKDNIKYNITDDTRDFFTLFTYLAAGGASEGTYTIDGNGFLWSATLTKDGREKISNQLGKFSCTRYIMRLDPITEGKMPYVDMVTHNLLNKSNKITFWITGDGIPLRAVVRKGMLSMSWEPTSISH